MNINISTQFIIQLPLIRKKNFQMRNFSKLAFKNHLEIIIE